MKTVAKLLIPKKDFAINVLWFINGPEIGLLDEVINFIAEELPWLVSMGYRISALNWFLLFWIFIILLIQIYFKKEFKFHNKIRFSYIKWLYTLLLFFIRKSVWYGTCSYLCASLLQIFLNCCYCPHGQNIIVFIFFITVIVFNVIDYWSHYFSSQS